MPCTYKGELHHLQFLVIEQNAPSILGRKTCQDLGTVLRIMSVDNLSEPHSPLTQAEIMSEYSDVFSGLGCLAGKHHIQIDTTVQPVIHAPRKVPVALREKVKTELERMVEMNVIEKQTEPTDWVSSMVCVVRPNKLRICIDPRDLNRAVKREHYPMQTVEEVVSRLPNAKIFSVLDASNGYWQVQLDDESSKLCTFNTPFGRYRFLRLPMGITSGSEVLGGNDQQHDQRLKTVLDTARAKNMKLNTKKTQIRKKEVHYVGHVITEKARSRKNPRYY